MVPLNGGFDHAHSTVCRAVSQCFQEPLTGGPASLCQPSSSGPVLRNIVEALDECRPPTTVSAERQIGPVRRCCSRRHSRTKQDRYSHLSGRLQARCDRLLVLGGDGSVYREERRCLVLPPSVPSRGTAWTVLQWRPQLGICGLSPSESHFDVYTRVGYSCGNNHWQVGIGFLVLSDSIFL